MNAVAARRERVPPIEIARSLDETTTKALAHELDGAENSRTQLRQFSQRFPKMTMADAYAVQRAWMELKIARGRRVIGHKIGLTSRAMQLAVGIDQPDSGVLLDDMAFEAGAIPISRFIVPRLEVELAFIMGRRLEGPKAALDDVLAATDRVVPALEIIDARIEQLDRDTKATRSVIDTISDNAADAGIVLGEKAVRPNEIDLRWIAALLIRNGAIEETGVAAGVLDHPGNGIAWLANRLATQGIVLEPGQIVLAGSFTRPVSLKKGDNIRVDFGLLGAIVCDFV